MPLRWVRRRPAPVPLSRLLLRTRSFCLSGSGGCAFGDSIEEFSPACRADDNTSPGRAATVTEALSEARGGSSLRSPCSQSPAASRAPRDGRWRCLCTGADRRPRAAFAPVGTADFNAAVPAGAPAGANPRGPRSEDRRRKGLTRWRSRLAPRVPPNRRGARTGGDVSRMSASVFLPFFVLDRSVWVSIMRTSSSAAVLERKRSDAGSGEAVEGFGVGSFGCFPGRRKKDSRNA